jgi:hypothetical protein
MHNIIPHRANKNQFSKPLECHLQGVIMHGQCLCLFRTFAGIGSGANLSIYTFLRTLETRLEKQGGVLPDVIYYQVDGGPENSNSDLLAIWRVDLQKRWSLKDF